MKRTEIKTWHIIIITGLPVWTALVFINGLYAFDNARLTTAEALEIKTRTEAEVRFSAQCDHSAYIEFADAYAELRLLNLKGSE